MQRSDLPRVSEQLNRLSEVYDKKPVGPKALEVWFDVLREFMAGDVMAALIAWPASHARFPAPAEIVKLLNDIRSTDLEQRSREQNKNAPREIPRGVTEYGMRCAAAIREAMKTFGKQPPRQWAHRIIEAKLAGTPLMYRYIMDGKMYPVNNKQITDEQFAFACDALRLRPDDVLAGGMREPGSDDEVVAHDVQ